MGMASSRFPSAVRFLWPASHVLNASTTQHVQVSHRRKLFTEPISHSRRSPTTFAATPFPNRSATRSHSISRVVGGGIFDNQYTSFHPLHSRSFMRLHPLNAKAKRRRGGSRHTKSRSHAPIFDASSPKVAAWTMLGFSPRHRTHKAEEMSRWMKDLMMAILRKMENTVEDNGQEGVCDRTESLQEIVDLLPLPYILQLKQKVDAILCHLSTDKEGKMVEADFDGDDEFDMQLLGEIFSDNGIKNIEKIMSLLPLAVKDEVLVALLRNQDEEVYEQDLQRQLSQARYNRWISGGEQRGVPLPELLEVWERVEEAGFAVRVHPVQGSLAAYTVGLSVNGGFAYDLLLPHISPQSATADTVSAVTHLVRELRLIGARLPAPAGLRIAVPHMGGVAVLEPVSEDEPCSGEEASLAHLYYRAAAGVESETIKVKAPLVRIKIVPGGGA